VRCENKPPDTMEFYIKNYYDARPNVTVERIPKPIYYSDVAKLAMTIEWAERATRDRDLSPYLDSNLLAHLDVLRRVTQVHQYILEVGIYGHYFED
jgi:hypothetical protein